MKKSIVWFSHKENKYDAELKLFQKYFYWTDKSPTWEWDNCAVTWIKKSEQELHIVIRSSKLVTSEYRGGRTVRVKYMLGFDVRAEDIHYPMKDDYPQPDNKKKKDGQVKSRWAFQLNKHYYIWQWAEEDSSRFSMWPKLLEKELEKERKNYPRRLYRYT